ncbi:MAG: helix-turn-helix domain-containing protein [Armatimonadetes bacterium]|nr:helix-turn-helix domain-containing protein [Armatimonadota bacterium]
MAKLAERQQARLLRKQGWSIKTIAKNLGVSRSSVSLWVRDIALTVEQREFIESRASQLHRERASQTRLASEDFTLSVYMHSDLGVTEMECRQFWEERLGLPITHLYWKANKGYNYRRRRSYFGTAYLKVRRSKMLLEYVKEWIQCLNKEIVSERA